MIHFFEIRPHDRDYYTSVLKKNKVVEHPQTLNEKNALWAKDAEVISIFVHSKINREVLDKLPNLRHLITRSVGTDHIDKAECEKRRITVWNITDYGPHTVAEHAFALMLGLTRNIDLTLKSIKSKNHYVDPEQNSELKGKTLGIVGTGLIGTEVAKRAHSFEMKIVACDHNASPVLRKSYGVTFKPLKDVLKQADILTLHVPLTSENKHLIDSSSLNLMKRGAFIINTARGGLIDSSALFSFIEKGHIARAGLDVLEGEEFIFPEHPLKPRTQEEKKKYATARALINHPHVLVTPHVAFGSKESIQRIREKTVSIINKLSM